VDADTLRQGEFALMKDAQGHGSNGAGGGGMFGRLISNFQAAAAMAQGHDKSAPVPIHSGTSGPRTYEPGKRYGTSYSLL